MVEISLNEAQSQLTTLADKTVAGESFVVTKEGIPVVALKTYEEPKKCRRIGFMKGRMTVPDDFDTMMADEIEEMFYGKDSTPLFPDNGWPLREIDPNHPFMKGWIPMPEENIHVLIDRAIEELKKKRMKILLDTNILIGSALANLPPKIRRFIEDDSYTFLFSPISIMEVVIKSRKNLPDFIVDPLSFYDELLEVGYEELPVISRHSLMVGSLPFLHKDPFDRLLLAQATCEGISFLTTDKILAKYNGVVVFVG